MNLMHYLLEANLYLVAFYLLYVLLLRSETLYQLNRVYLIVTALVAFLIPLLQLGILKPNVTSTATVSVDAYVSTAAVVMPAAEAPTWNLTDYALAIYSGVTLALLAYLVFKIIKLIVLSKKGITKQLNGFKIIEMPGQNVAFSFFGYLFVNTELLSSPTILHHEEVHIRQKHSWDVIYFELLRIINWFNPVVYLMQKSIKEVHEFIADEQVARAENGASDYAEFLISNAYGLTPIQLTNSFFNKNLLKRRIIMLYQKRSGKAARLKYLVALPMATGMLCLSTMAFTNKTYGWVDLAPQTTTARLQVPQITPLPNINIDKSAQNEAETPIIPAKENNELQPLPADTVFKKVEVLPQFPGGTDGFSRFLVNNVKYPAIDKENNVQGRVFIQFVIEKDGSLTDIKSVRAPSTTLAAEGIRVLGLSPKWTPGMQKGQPVRVQFTVPINFSLADDNSSKPTTQVTLAPPPAAGTTIAQTSGAPIYNAVEVQPAFPGGEQAFATFLVQNVRYPKEAKDANVTGRVFVQFIVETDGSLSSIKIVRDPGKGLGDEAVRVLNLSPKWKPGFQGGKAVRVQYTVPINFSLAENAPVFAKGLYAQIMNKVRYPADAKQRNIQGRVFVSFTLNADKKVQDVVTLRAPDKTMGDEVARIVNSFDGFADWKANVNYVIPVNFRINYGDNVKDSPAPINSQPVSNKYQPGSLEKISLSEVVVTTYGPLKQ